MPLRCSTDRPTPSISDHRADVPPALVFIVERCLEKDRQRRFADVTQLSAALAALEPTPSPRSRFASARPLTAKAVEEATEPPLRPRRRWVGVLCGLAVLGGCVAVLGQGMRQGHIHVPSAAEIRQVPSRIASWRFSLPFHHDAPEQ